MPDIREEEGGLSVLDTCRTAGFKRTKLYKELNDPDSDFPRPYKIGSRTYFLKSEILAWLRARPRIERPVKN
jgi:predicted DNA-binding transcriptional regulator AlpA